MINLTNKKSFIKLFSTPLGYYCYDVNTSSMLNITGESYNILSGNSTENSIEDFDEIIKYKNNGYLLEDRPDIIEHPYTKLIDGYLKSNVRKVTLQITQNCNLKCKYCNYAYPINGIQRHHTNKSMPYETAIKGIDFLFDHCDNEQEINIGFYGGEPLLEFTKIKSLITYANKKAEKRQKKLSYALTTNGTILNDRIVETVINNDIKIVVSLDGPRDIHNKNRVYQKTGLGSFDDVINNLDNFINKYPALVNQISINSVIDTENDFDCYNDFFMDYRIIKDFRVNASSMNKRMLATQFDTKEKYIMKYRYEKFKLFLALLEKVDMKDISLIVKQYRYDMRKIADSFKDTIKLSKICHHGGPCVAGSSRLFIDVKGNFFPCERCSEKSYVMKIGHIDSGFDIDAVKKLLNIGKITENECRNCWNIRLCLLCATSADVNIEFSKSIKLINCARMKESTQDKIYDYLALKEFGFDENIVWNS